MASWSLRPEVLIVELNDGDFGGGITAVEWSARGGAVVGLSKNKKAV
jgi:hypothetical protein